MANLTVKVDAKSVRRKKIVFKSMLVLLILLLLLISLTYGVLYVINQKGNFTITLDPNAYEQEKLLVSPRRDFKHTTHKLVIESLEYMDNISESWIPNDVDSIDGPHNGNNYMAYTFYVKNNSDDTLAYSIAIDVLSVIKDVDDAIRVAVYLNGEKTVYAKRSPDTGDIEKGTTPFVRDDQVMNELRENFLPGDVDRFTIVVWLEGDDPECLNHILGGEMKMEMTLGENTKKYER